MLEFITSILYATVVSLIVKLILFKDKKKWLKDHPIIEYRLELSLYFFHKYIYSPFFSVWFPLCAISITLFDPNYDTLPRFTAAWIFYGVGLFVSILFNFMNKNYNPPVKPI